MRIDYKENPLRTVVELDEQEQKNFWLKVKVEELQHRLFEVHFHLDKDSGYFDVCKAAEYADPKHYMQEDYEEQVSVDKRVDMMVKSYLEELNGEHCGDCTKVACSCMKCQAEDVLGVDTMEGFSRGYNYINYAFTVRDDGVNGKIVGHRTLKEALEYLKNYKVDPDVPDRPAWKGTTPERYAVYVAGWESRAAETYKELLEYARKHFPESVV